MIIFTINIAFIIVHSNRKKYEQDELFIFR